MKERHTQIGCKYAEVPFINDRRRGRTTSPLIDTS